jgi:hypothetical protein
MFCDVVQLKLGDQTAKIRRLTIGEIRSGKYEVGDGVPFGDKLDDVIRSHVTTADGKPLDVAELSIPQMRQVVNALVGPPEDSPLSDFIGLLS